MMDRDQCYAQMTSIITRRVRFKKGTIFFSGRTISLIIQITPVPPLGPEPRPPFFNILQRGVTMCIQRVTPWRQKWKF
jgi:hypothetical protein